MTATRSVPADVARSDDASTVRLLRWGVLLLAATGVAGAATELAMLRHWQEPIQLLAWVFLALDLLALILVAVRPRALGVLAARVLAALVAAGSLYGVFVHVQANYRTAPLDGSFSERWQALSEPARWWAASTGQVGPTPSLVPLVLAQVALVILLATVRHPALTRREVDR